MNPTQPPWIAIVDDNLAIRQALLRLLRSAGTQARAFASGQDFFAALRSSPHDQPDCVVLDLQMPQMSGVEVLMLLAEEASHIPVIVITGQHKAENHARVMQSKPFCYLLKPMDDQILLDAIARALAQRGGGCLGSPATSERTA